MFELEKQKKFRVVTGIICPNLTFAQSAAEERLSETIRLGEAINLNIVYTEVIKLRQINAGNFFNKGTISRLSDVVKLHNLGLVIMDANLTPVQQRNLEKSLNVKIIDRTALILEIFGERAQTKEGSLQVELAHLTYQRSRLVRSWTHLERQRGGAGFLGGPGETQIELDRRIIDDKITKIKNALAKIKQTRGLQRRARKKVPYPIVALVGYTNTGKSTLFNRLTKSAVFAKDLLFATLDPSMRRLKLPSGREIILSDTVGFISDLPHELIMAFRATLEEVLESDIIIQVIDASGTNSKQQREDVIKVLHSLGLEHIEHQKDYIEVYNKIDLLENKPKKQKNNNLYLSAKTGEGCDNLLHNIDKVLSLSHQTADITIDAGNGELLAWLYRNSEIVSKKLKEDKIHLTIKISDSNKQKLDKKFFSA